MDFLDKAQNFSKITKDDCLDRLIMASARGDLDMSVDEMSEVATDQAYAAAASYVANNQLPMLGRRYLGQQIDTYQKSVGGTTMTSKFGDMRQGLASQRARNTRLSQLPSSEDFDLSRVDTAEQLRIMNDLNSKPSAKHNRAPQPQPAAMTPFTSSTVSSITDATPDYVKVVRDMAIDKMMESTDAETELKLNKVVDELSGEGKNASLVNIIKRGDEKHKDPEKVLTACMNRMN